MNNEHIEIFREEAYELLEELETSLLELEKNTGDEELVGKVFRALHTIKGSGAMFGFDSVSEFTHNVENVFDMVRSGEMQISKELIDLTLSAGDVVKRMLDAGESDDDVVLESKRIVDALHGIAQGTREQPSDEETVEGEAVVESEVQEPGIDEDKAKEEPVREASPGEPTIERTYRIRFKPSRDIIRKGSDVQSLINEIRALGECKVVVHLKNVPPLQDLEADGCYFFWDIVLTTTEGINAIKDVFIFVESDAEISIDLIDRSDIEEEAIDYKKLGYILVERGDISVTEMQKAINSQKLFGEILVEEGLVETDKIESALVEQEHVREVRTRRQKEEAISTLRVPADKADKLVNLVGELVTLQARLGQISESMNEPELLAISEEAERLVWDLRDNTMSIRMVPIGTCFARFNRLVRDLSGKLEKEVELVAEGGETELDKTVIERLNDPLVHLIRNCIDHGVEPPGEREALGKERKGTINLIASYSGANVLIVIKDNGSGIDPEAVKARALERGLIKPDADLSNNEVYSLLFEPGFSTASEVTNVSGRGVGMDVVKKNIEALRGSIHVDSTRGEGTVITLKIPLTLAIIDGLLVDIGDEHFILPLSLVEEIVELTADDIKRSHGRRITNIRGNIVPYIMLREQFDIAGKQPDIQQIVVVELENRKVGFVVDQVIGKHQTVIKSLGKVYQNVAGLSGATILGDGTVALILDVFRLAQLELIEEEKQ